MSFRLRIFMLVMIVAVTAIGATAWLTLSLTSREVERSQRASVQHQTTIVDAVQRFGLLRGRWPGLDRVVAGLATATRLHIQLRTGDGLVLVDSDTMQGRPSGPVQGAALGVDARPALSPRIAAAADRLTEPGASGVVSPELADPGAPPVRLGYKPVTPRDLFGAEPTDDIFGSPPALMVRQAAQYRAALIAVRCIDEKAATGDPALLIDKAPYLTGEQVTRNPECVKEAVLKVVTDEEWINGVWATYSQCERAGSPEGNNSCLYSSFTRAVTAASAVPLQLLLGPRTDTDGVGSLGRPAAFGAAGLVAVALVGTALIARRVSRPVRRLTEASRELADGRLDVRVPVGGGSELARLSASFNAMAEALQRSEERQRRLVADVAHEMRTPLSNLRGYLEGLSDGVVQPSRELFASLHEETLLQRRILDDLQVLALAEAGDLNYTTAPVDLADLVSGGATAHRVVAADAGVALTVDAPAPVWVDADPDRLRQVLGNLLSNAIRYTDRDGHVLLRVRAEGTEAVLTVQDNGVGIAPGDLSRVFDRFWRADPARQRATGGTGLGLTIAHRIVTDHGGRIEVTSRQHLGTTFTVRLPGRP
ncbi:two-component sensor histidine kinase [Actinoplanes sp. NBRC 14428]|uniref:histidine kinase n=1 Tax=Pseudosporangium ferrugineum TaxID=439699 RepID=A0A2T0RKF9_9ACTN|nr:ATP-binding protein [Pseudosporangium ferrugineum]PRY21675.1 two-component system sensor histidine kinase BaeS [Pseudosporangium ferrugineum]BCJ49246.1 two-component sensor histidine kinase [Actinoplanes sp. NBRC 14428]